MRNLKRALSMVLALAMVFSFVGLSNNILGARADSYDQSLVNQFTDIRGHWASDGLTNLIGYGYMRGVGNNQAAPNETLTTAQLVALLVRIMGGAQEADLSGYADMDPRAWYYSEMAQGLYMGIIPNTNSNYMNPKQEASREYAAYMLCRAFGLTVREPITDYTDADKVSDWAVSSMQAMVAAKAIVGTDGRNGRYLNPQETITRGEFAQMVYRLNEDFIKDGDSSSISKQTFNNGLLIAKSGVTLSDCTIKGNLYIADCVGNGTVTLKNTKVEGNIYARGGGDHSVHLEDGSTANSVVLINPYMATRLVVSENSKINGVLVNNGKDRATLEGPVGNVTINVSDVDLYLDGATATNVIVNSADSVVTVDKDSKVETLSIASSSSGVKIDSKGIVQRLALMANDAELNLSGTLDYLLIGAVSGLKLDIDKSITLGSLDLHCSDSTISIDSEVKSINVSAFSDKLKLDLGSNAKVLAIGIASPTADLSISDKATIGSVTIDAPKYKGGVAGLALNNLTIGAGATEAEITVDGKADITNMFVNADKVKVSVVTGSRVKDIHVVGKNAEVSGNGTVERVNAAITAEGLTVTTGDTAVANAGADKVTAGGIEVPANKVYVTTTDGKDVVRNNDGTPDGDGDRTTGAGQEASTVANFELSFAQNATADDIHSSRNWVLGNLVDSISFTKNTNKGAAYVLTGNVKKVDNFTPTYDPVAGYGTGYYVPVVVSADFMKTESDWTCTVNGITYTKNNLSQGQGYKDQLIVFLQLSRGNSTRIATVTLDRDGNGTKYAPVTVGVDYTTVHFDGVQDFSNDIISYPTTADKTDIAPVSTLGIADFGNMNITKTSGNTYSAGGTAFYMGENTVVGNVVNSNPTTTRHYLPVMINTSGFATGWSVVMDDQTKFTAGGASTGANLKGHLILLLALDSTKNFYTIYVDSDGDGYTNDSYVLNVGNVVLSNQGGTPTTTSRLSLPVNANSLDLVGTGISAISNLGSFGITEKYLSSPNSIVLTGGAAEQTLPPNINTTSKDGKYYFPLLVDTSDFGVNWVVSTSIGGSYNRYSAIPMGGNYGGKLLIFLKLENPSSVTKLCTVNIDKDGNGVSDETWNVYSQVTLGSVVEPPVTLTDRISIPTQANVVDLSGTGLSKISDLGTFGMSAKVTYTEITGEANALNQAPTGNVVNPGGSHYVPLVISTKDFTGAWTVKANTTNTFTSANVVQAGGNYYGNLLVFVALPEPNGETNAFVTFSIDKNGDGVVDETYQFVNTATLKSGTTQPPTSNDIKISLPVEGNAIDFAGTGFDKISDFGTFTIKDRYNDHADAYQISGTANYIEKLPGGNMQHDLEHHYVPVVIDTTGFSGNWSVNCATGNKFTKADVVAAGGNYAGKLIVLIDMYHLEGEALSEWTALLLVDRTGSGDTEMVRIYDNVTLTPKVVEDYGDIPDGVTVSADRVSRVIDVYDVNNALFNDQGQVKAEEAVRVIKAWMLDQGLTNIKADLYQGTYTFQGTLGTGMTMTYYCDLSSNIHASYRVSVYYPGSNNPVSVIETGEVSVQDVIDAFRDIVTVNDSSLGKYYFKGTMGEVAMPITGARSDKITGTTALYIGYYKVELPVVDPESPSNVANGVTLSTSWRVPVDYTAPEGVPTYYVAAGDTVEVDCTLTGKTNGVGTIVVSGPGVSWGTTGDTSNVNGLSWSMGSGSVTFTTAVNNTDPAHPAGYTVSKTYTLTTVVNADIAFSITATSGTPVVVGYFSEGEQAAKNGVAVSTAAVEDWTDSAADSDNIAAGKTISVTIEGKTFTTKLVASVTQGATDEVAIGDCKPDETLTAVKANLAAQIAAANTAAASGESSYNKIENFDLVADGTTTSQLNWSAKVTPMTYVAP